MPETEVSRGNTRTVQTADAHERVRNDSVQQELDAFIEEREQLHLLNARSSTLESPFGEDSFNNHASLLGDGHFQSTAFTDRRIQVVRRLQRDYGNQYVLRLLDHISRKENKGIQTKLTVGSAGDKYEQEADRVAKQVVSMSQVTNPSSVQRDEDERLRRSVVNGQPEVGAEGGDISAEIESSVQRARGHGHPLPDDVRTSMESAFGVDFSGVHIHTGAEADALNRSVSARAFTTGQDIFFRNGEYNPVSTSGKETLAHELTHVVQQNSHSMEIKRKSDSNGPTSSPRKNEFIQRVELTYDDGPDSAGNTRRTLRALNAGNGRATFYLVGRRILEGDNWRTVFDIAASGHWIGNHAFDWNMNGDNHVWLSGTVEERAQKILQTEWAIRDALVRGRSDAQQNNTWDRIPQANRAYIEDMIAHGTGRFRTPGFKSHFWTRDGTRNRAAIGSVNQVLAASGLHTLAITEITEWGITREGVTVDPEDWRSDRTQAEIESGVNDNLDSNSDSVVLHSRVGATADATPAIVANINQHADWSYDPTARGTKGSIMPRSGFAGLQQISDPPTSSEIATARTFLRQNKLTMGPYLAGSVALGIFQLAQRSGDREVEAFINEIKQTSIRTPDGPIPMANWMNENPNWRLFAWFFQNWHTNQPYPRTGTSNPSQRQSNGVQRKLDKQVIHSQESNENLRATIQRHGNHRTVRDATAEDGRRPLTDRERYEHTIRHAGITRREWEAGYNRTATFLGISIARGIHVELEAKLRQAEDYLRDLHSGQSDAEIANAIGLRTISGLRPVRNAVGGSTISLHCYGLAIDVNYSANPFVARSNTVDRIIARATQFILGNAIHIRREQPGSIEEIRARYEQASNALEEYFSMRSDRDRIAEVLRSSGLRDSPRVVNRWMRRIRRDYANPELRADFAGTPNRDPAAGFIDLSQELVEALGNQADLTWGGQYRTGKDMMHFDWRDGTIDGRPYSTGHRI